jgi:hypothetical protein
MEAHERVFAAADELFADCDRQKFPTVYEVRKRAGVSMAVANEAMQLWRARKLVSIAKPIEVAIPPPVQAASHTALSQLWTAATDIARQSLIAAQVGFDDQTAAAKAHSVELSLAFDAQSAEFDALRTEYESYRATCTAAAADNGRESRRVQAELEILTDRANTATARMEETQKQVEDLRIARDREQTIAKGVVKDCSQRLERAELRVADAVAAETMAREASARYCGQLESLKVQHADLVRTLQPDSKNRRLAKTTK